MLLFEDLALGADDVPDRADRRPRGDRAASCERRCSGMLVVAAMLVFGRFALAALFAQAARTKNPELFLAISLLTVILASLATGAVGLSPILGALIAGVLIAETEYHAEVEAITAPLAGLALGIFLITVGMRIDLGALVRRLAADPRRRRGVLIVKAAVTTGLLRASGVRLGVAVETGVMMASPSETSLIVSSAAGGAGLIAASDASFWTTVTAIGLTVTPLLAAAGQADGPTGREQCRRASAGPFRQRTDSHIRLRPGRPDGRRHAARARQALSRRRQRRRYRPRRRRQRAMTILFGDVTRPELADRLQLGHAAALVLTMDDPVQVARIARRVRGWVPDLPIIARARDTAHAAQLYKAGVTDAVPETLEASLQLAEAVLVDIGAANGAGDCVDSREARPAAGARSWRRPSWRRSPTLGRGGCAMTLSRRARLEAKHAGDISPVLGIVGWMALPS